MPEKPYSPGTRPLDRLNITAPDVMLGGAALRDVDPGEALKRMRIGLMESGALPTPLYHATIEFACDGNPNAHILQVPEGKAWRVYAVGGHLASAAGVPDFTGTSLWAGVIGALSPTPPTETNCSRTSGDFGAGDFVLLDGGAGYISWQGSMILRYGMDLAWGQAEAAPLVMKGGVLYCEMDGTGVPPR